MLSDIDKDRIAAAVAKAEESTSGEILVTLAGEVSKYREIPLAWAAAIALALPPIVFSLSLQPLAALVGDLWVVGQMGALESELAVGLALYAVIQIVLFLAILAIVHIPSIRRALTPRVLKRHRVMQAAHHQFASMGARTGASETGVLIFVALEDRQVQILADAGIHQKCGEAPWIAAAAAIAKAMKAGHDPTAGIIEAVEICGEALKAHYPGSGAHAGGFSDRPLEV
ncbi:MAG TPA: TPM domain-containing protein [Caulobacteraceae bacterium]|jgi:putative membrane protein